MNCLFGLISAVSGRLFGQVAAVSGRLGCLGAKFKTFGNQ